MKKIIPRIRSFTKRADMVLFTLCMVCALFGIVMVSSASASLQGGAGRYVSVQVVSMLIGIVLFVVLTIIDIDIIADKWMYLAAFEFFLLLLLLTPLGYADDTGNRAWLRLGFMGIQPSEIIKVTYIIILAKQISYLKSYKRLNSALSVGQIMLHILLTIGLIVVISKDMGSALVFLFVAVIMLFAAGLKFYWFLAGLAVTAALFPLFWTKVLNQRYRDRILAPYDPSIDPLGTDIRWQTNQSKMALGSGGLTGTGLYQGQQSQSEAIPAKQTDFIFAVIGEELGMIGCIVVMLLLMAVIIRCIYVGVKSKNTMSMLVCFGVAGSLMFQTFENVGMCIGIAPVIGITLPFFSYGGSSMFATFAMMGLVSGVKYRPKPERFRSLM